MGFKQRRALIKVGESRGVILPRSWVDFYSGKLNNPLILADGGILMVVADGYEEKARGMFEKVEEMEMETKTEMAPPTT